MSDADKKSQLTEMTKKLETQERTEGGSGAVPNTPKRMLLDASELQKKNPDKHYRWVNIGTSDKAQSRQVQGYEKVSASEGGRQVGNLALFAVPRQQFEQRVAAIEKLGRDRLNAHKADVEQMADSIARELRDRHGIQVDAERIIIRE